MNCEIDVIFIEKEEKTIRNSGINEIKQNMQKEESILLGVIFTLQKLDVYFFESFLYIEFEAWQKEINIFQAYRLCPTQQR